MSTLQVKARNKPRRSGGEDVNKPYPEWICASCGEEYGRHTCKKEACWHVGTCDICGAVTSVTEPRDFGHLDGYTAGHQSENISGL